MNDKAREIRKTVMTDVRQKLERDLTDTRYNWLRSQPRRKALVLVTFLTLVTYGLSAHFDYGLVTLPALIVFGVCLWLLRASVRGVMDYPDDILDERIRELRGYTYRYAFLGAMCLMSMYLVLYIANQILVKMGHVQAITAEQLHDWAFVLLFSSMVLPSAIHAWTEPDV